jgi:hypothetical protein
MLAEMLAVHRSRLLKQGATRLTFKSMKARTSAQQRAVNRRRRWRLRCNRLFAARKDCYYQCHECPCQS